MGRFGGRGNCRGLGPKVSLSVVVGSMKPDGLDSNPDLATYSCMTLGKVISLCSFCLNILFSCF